MSCRKNTNYLTNKKEDSKPKSYKNGEENEELNAKFEKLGCAFCNHGETAREEPERNIPPDLIDKIGFDKAVVKSKLRSQVIRNVATLKFGPFGVAQIMSTWAMQPAVNIRNFHFHLDGELEGGHQFVSLLLNDHVAMKKEEGERPKRDTVYMDELAHEYSGYKFSWLIADEAENVREALKKKADEEKIDSGLPITLQYLDASDVPMGKNTRKAHLNWSIQYCQKQHIPFDGMDYRIRMARTDEKLVPERAEGALKAIEITIRLTNSDKAIGDPEVYLRKKFSFNLF